MKIYNRQEIFFMYEEGSQLKPIILCEDNNSAEVKSRSDGKGKAKTMECHPH